MESQKKKGKRVRLKLIIKEIMVEIFPNLTHTHTHTHTHIYIYTPLQIQEAEQIPKRINSKKSTPRHIKIKFLKTKNKNFQNQ